MIDGLIVRKTTCFHNCHDYCEFSSKNSYSFVRFLILLLVSKQQNVNQFKGYLENKKKLELTLMKIEGCLVRFAYCSV